MPSPLTSWTWDPAQLLLIAAAAFLYYRRAHTLAVRGTPVPAWRRLVFALGLLLAFPIWAVNLVLWHLPFAYQGALHHWWLHAIQHILFFTCGCLMWAPVLEVLPAPEWFGTGAKLGYIAAVRIVETILGNVFVWSGGVFYHYYEHPVHRWGILA